MSTIPANVGAKAAHARAVMGVRMEVGEAATKASRPATKAAVMGAQAAPMPSAPPIAKAAQTATIPEIQALGLRPARTTTQATNAIEHWKAAPNRV